MIRLPDVPLPAEAHANLAEYQREVDTLPDYAARVVHAKGRFAALNKKGNSTFDSVKATLAKMNSGARRCAYCEDSAADEVEHIRPKTLYPELVFAWVNYLYACGPCNGPKNNHFAVFAEGTGALTNVARARNAPVVPPIAGKAVFIDPVSRTRPSTCRSTCGIPSYSLRERSSGRWSTSVRRTRYVYSN